MAQISAKKNTILNQDYIFRSWKVQILIFTLLAIYYFIFESFFPNEQGKLGHDYLQFLPKLLDGVYWFRSNGIFSVPWFTPSFGGGIPNLPNPQSIYYSIPQFLSFFLNPLLSIKITFFLFGVIGFYGFYFLLKKIFSFSTIVSILGATLFLFNGFYSHRMLIGHITFHSYMLLPFFIYFLLNEVSLHNYKSKLRLAADINFAGVIIAYVYYSGGFHILPPILITSLIFTLIFKTMKQEFNYKGFLLKILLSIILGHCLAASKLNSSLSFLSYFPRDLYPLPGVESFYDLIKICLQSLFLTPDIDLANQRTTNRVFYLEQHEYEFGISLLPIFVIPFGVFKLITKLKQNQYSNSKNLITNIILLLFLLFIPLLLNYYTPSWNAFLKSIPFIKNSSTNIRWFSIYIPTFILLSCLSIEKVPYLNLYKIFISISGVLLILLTNLIHDRKFYHIQNYDPNIILEGYTKLTSENIKPEIKIIGTRGKLNDGSIIVENDLLTFGASPINPYEPIFGYRLENFPKGSLSLGPVMEENTSEILNIKNPACYVFPDENQCSVGDHFTIKQKEEADKFRKYKPFSFSVSVSQIVSNVLTIVFSILSFSLTIFYFINKIYSKSN